MSSSSSSGRAWRFLTWMLGIALTLIGLALNTITFATPDHRPIVRAACACAACALVLFALVAPRMTRFERLVTLALALSSSWTLLDGGGRRLLGVLG